MLGTCLDQVRRVCPLIHNITNYVTVNDVANVLLVCGGSPIMSDEPEDPVGAGASTLRPNTAVCTMGLAGEIGWARMEKGDGNSTYRNRIIDAIDNMTGEILERGAKYEIL